MYEQHTVVRLLAPIAVIAMLGASATASAGLFDRIRDALGGKKASEQSLTDNEVSGGLREALRVGTESVVAQLGQPGGFNLDEQIHIPLPGQLDQVRSLLEKIGMDDTLRDLELRLNSAAEIATPKAQRLFMDAIAELTLEDAMAIYNGSNDSATQYFKSKMAAPLAREMKPVVDESLADAGAVSTYDAIMSRYSNIPFAPRVETDLSDYVVEKGMDGIFFYLAREEAAIRENPAKRTTDILKRVFGR